MSGEITIVMPFLARPGTWKLIDFPPPVGKSAKTSFPTITSSTMASWDRRKESNPQNCDNISTLFFNSSKTKIRILLCLLISLNQIKNEKLLINVETQIQSGC